MPAGKSRSLADKLGIREGQRIAILHQPAGYARLLGKIPEGSIITSNLGEGVDFVQLFEREAAALERDFRVAKEKLSRSGMIWVAWPKASAKTRSELSGGLVREIGLRNGMVDVKVCSVDETWSALKFVFRTKDRE